MFRSSIKHSISGFSFLKPGFEIYTEELIVLVDIVAHNRMLPACANVKWLLKKSLFELGTEERCSKILFLRFCNFHAVNAVQELFSNIGKKLQEKNQQKRSIGLVGIQREKFLLNLKYPLKILTAME